MKFFISIFFTWFYTTAQSPKIVNGLGLLKKSETNLKLQNHDSAFFYAKQSLELFRGIENDTLAIQSAIQLIEITNKVHKEEQNDYILFAEKNARNSSNFKLLADIYYAKGNSFFSKGEHGISLPIFLKVDSICKSNNFNNDTFIKSLIKRSEIARLRFSYEGTENAYKLLLEALQYAEEINSEEMIHYTYVFLANMSGQMNKLDDAKRYIDLSLKYYLKVDNIKKVSRIHLINSSYYKAIDNMPEAKKSSKAQVTYLRTKNDSLELASALTYYGNFLRMNTNQYSDALKSFKEAEKIFNLKKVNESELYQRMLRGMAIIHKGMGNFKESTHYFEEAYYLKQDLLKKENSKQTKNLETKYQTEKKEQEITLLTSQNKLAEQQKKSQRNLLLGGIGLTSIAGIFMFVLFRNRQKTTKKLQNLDIAKSNFFTNISHEFRTPLTLISGPIQQQLTKKDLSSDERSNFEMINRNTNRLLSLVDQLLDISKVESGNLTLNITNSEITPFIGSLADGFSFKAKERKIDYQINIEPSTIDSWFDKDVLEKIITNLISNAVKYTPENGTIECSTLIKDNNVSFIIKNSGKGMTKEQLKKVFNRFYQISEDNKGTGIGLALVKELVTLHKGAINVESTPNNWTTFTVKLPITKKVFKENEITIHSTSNDLTKKQVNYIDTIQTNTIIDNSTLDEDKPILLIVDDNADIRTYVSSIFKGSYTLLQAQNGQEGIDIAIEQIPDIIISDIMMPIKNGIELCNTLKVDERTSHIPIIILTAKAGEENEIEGVKTGADDYITKPFNNELLKLKVEKLLENIKKLQERFSQEIILKATEISISSTDELFLNRLQGVLDDKLVESTFNTDDFCKSINMSRMQLHRKLKALFNMTTTEFIRSQRLKLAADLLRTSDVTVSQVGYSVGFNDPAYFSKRFKEIYECTPTQYAKKDT